MRNSPETDTLIDRRVKNELTEQTYPSLLGSMPYLAFFSCMLVYKLGGHENVNTFYLHIWLGAFLTITLLQGVLAAWFNQTKDQEKWQHVYFKLLLVDVALVGLMWGTAGVLFMPSDTLAQSYLVFIMTFAAGGGLLFLSRSYIAGLIYSTSVLLPLVGSIVYSFFAPVHHEVYFNLTLGLIWFWLFLLAVCWDSSKSFANNLKHQIVTKSLSEDLSQAQEELEKFNAVSRDSEEKFFLSNPNHETSVQNNNETLYKTDDITNLDTMTIAEIKFVQSRAYTRRHFQNLAVFRIDIDNFQDVVTAQGEDAANSLLKTVALRLQYCKRETDILTRIDGNKFVLVISEVLLGHEIAAVASKILKSFAEKTLVDHGKVEIHSSIGVSVLPRDGENLDELITKAEVAMSYPETEQEDGKLHYQIYDAGITHKEKLHH